MAQRIKTVQESDLRMLGDLARNIQRVLPVTQADIDAAAALGKGWVVTRVFEVSDPLDNMRGGTQLVIRQNSILPGQSVQRVLIVSGPGGQTVVIRGTDYIVLPDAIANSLSYVKAFGGTEQRNLPDGYIERQYIYMMDGSYIRVEDLPISAGYKVEFDFQTTSLGSSLRNYLGGRANGVSAGGGFRLSKLASGGTTLNRVVLYGFETGTEYYDPTAQFQPNTRYKYTYNNGVCRLETGGSVVSTRTFTVTDDTSTYWGINSYANGTSYTLDSDGIYVYSLKVWDDQGELVMDLVPVVQRGTVPVVGFYDAATGGFRGPTGGTFAAGPELAPTPDAPMDIVSNNGVLKARHQSGLPLGYKLVDYIKANARIELDTLTNNTMEFVARFYREGLNPQYLYQSDTTSGGTTNTTAYMSSGGNWRFGSRTAAIDVGTGVMITSVQNADGVWINGEQVGTYEGVTAFTSTNNLRLFGTMQATPQLRLYGLKVYQNGAPFYDLVPCQRESDSAYGVYDLVRGQFFTNTDATITTGSFVSDPVEIYTDGTVETINIHGKNLFDKNNANILSAFISGSGNVSASGIDRLIYLQVEAGKTYYVSFTGNGGGRIAFFDNVPSIGSQGVSVRNFYRGGAITVPTGMSYFGFHFNTNSVSLNDMLNTLQIELGSTATEYEPYYDGGTATAEMLLKVGDYQDEQEILSGAITRKVGVKVLDGTENWTYTSSRFRLEISDYLVGSSIMATIISHYKLPAIASGSIAVGEARFSKASATDTVSDKNTLLIHDNNHTSLNSYKAWLTDQAAAGTPVIVLYPLATPTTESVTGQTLQVQDGDNTLEITQASLTGLELEAEYQAAVSLTIQEVQDANLDNNVEVTIS